MEGGAVLLIGSGRGFENWFQIKAVDYCKKIYLQVPEEKIFNVNVD